LALVLANLACQPEASTEQSFPPVGGSEDSRPENIITVVVASVADGDSFRAVDGDLEVRLLGVNAPERDECFGSESGDWLSDQIGSREVQIVTVATDQFDRTLAWVYVDERLINQELVATGHGLVLSDGDRDSLFSAEDAARAAGLGMWGSDICGATGHKAQVEIVDIDYNPSGEDQDERVTIANREDGPVDLSGFLLRDESSVNRFEFPSRSLAAGSELVISTACEGSADLFWCSSEPVWNNGGDTALLLDQHGRIVSLLRY
jgi:endonuclease YncB( thermonuclease family)